MGIRWLPSGFDLPSLGRNCKLALAVTAMARYKWPNSVKRACSQRPKRLLGARTAPGAKTGRRKRPLGKRATIIQVPTAHFRLAPVPVPVASQDSSPLHRSGHNSLGRKGLIKTQAHSWGYPDGPVVLRTLCRVPKRDTKQGPDTRLAGPKATPRATQRPLRAVSVPIPPLAPPANSHPLRITSILSSLLLTTASASLHGTNYLLVSPVIVSLCLRSLVVSHHSSSFVVQPLGWSCSKRPLPASSLP